MSSTALALVLASAAVHALWNTLLAGARDTHASTAAALLAGRVEARGLRVGVTISGGNVVAERFAELISAP